MTDATKDVLIDMLRMYREYCLTGENAYKNVDEKTLNEWIDDINKSKISNRVNN